MSFTFLTFVTVLRALGCEGFANFGIGSPRGFPPLLAVLRYIIALCNPWGHGYALPEGRPSTLKAIAANCRATLGITIQLGQVMILEGSKPGIRYILEALSLQGIVVLPKPWYPGHLGGLKRTGCQAHFIAMPTVRAFIKTLQEELGAGLKPVAIILSFDNPRWLAREYDDYKDLVLLAQRYGFKIISDEAYRDLAYNGRVNSIMQVLGWERYAICLQTASKPFRMAGWKLGALITNEKWLQLILTRKREDSEGGSPPAQKAWAVALRWCRHYPRRLGQVYFARAKYTVEYLLTVPGIFDIRIPEGGMFLYFGIGVDSIEFRDALLELGFEVSPGINFGEPDHIRWCLNQGHWVTRRAIVALAKILWAALMRQAA